MCLERLRQTCHNRFAHRLKVQLPQINKYSKNFYSAYIPSKDRIIINFVNGMKVGVKNQIPQQEIQLDALIFVDNLNKLFSKVEAYCA